MRRLTMANDPRQDVTDLDSCCPFIESSAPITCSQVHRGFTIRSFNISLKRYLLHELILKYLDSHTSVEIKGTSCDLHSYPPAQQSS